MMRIALGISYDGSTYCGWQSQPCGCGVQDVLETAIAQIAQHSVRVNVAGRTDTGVHAHAQVVHFDSETNRPLSSWVRGVNAHLPANIRVIWSKYVDETFHARFSAHARSYQYLLYNAPVASALMATKAGWFHLPLNVASMQVAAQFLLGEHDFSAFRASECQAKSPIKTMYQASVRAQGAYILFEFSASAFVQHQVRNMVGALIYVGKGAQAPSFIADLLVQKDRTLSPPTFSPNGLYLTHVSYDDKWQFPQAQNAASDFAKVLI
jgi:tRNA pseudouridine38-40 synthase